MNYKSNQQETYRYYKDEKKETLINACIQYCKILQATCGTSPETTKAIEYALISMDYALIASYF